MSAPMVLQNRFQVVRRDADNPPGWIEVPGTVTDLLDRVTGNTARDLFYLSEFLPQPRGNQQKRASEFTRQLDERLHRARKTVISNKGGWLFRKAKPSTTADEGPEGDAEERDEEGQKETSASSSPAGWKKAGTPSRMIDLRALSEAEKVSLLALQVGMGFTMVELAKLPEWERDMLLNLMVETQTSPIPVPESAIASTRRQLRGAPPKRLTFSGEEGDRSERTVTFFWDTLLLNLKEVESQRKVLMIPSRIKSEIGEEFYRSLGPQNKTFEGLANLEDRRAAMHRNAHREVADRRIRANLALALGWL